VSSPSPLYTRWSQCHSHPSRSTSAACSRIVLPWVTQHSAGPGYQKGNSKPHWGQHCHWVTQLRTDPSSTSQEAERPLGIH